MNIIKNKDILSLLSITSDSMNFNKFLLLYRRKQQPTVYALLRHHFSHCINTSPMVDIRFLYEVLTNNLNYEIVDVTFKNTNTNVSIKEVRLIHNSTNNIVLLFNISGELCELSINGHNIFPLLSYGDNAFEIFEKLLGEIDKNYQYYETQNHEPICNAVDIIYNGICIEHKFFNDNDKFKFKTDIDDNVYSITLEKFKTLIKDEYKK